MPRIKKNSGFTLLELMIGAVMISLVMVAAFSLYTTGLNLFTKTATRDITQAPEPVIEEVARRINTANFASFDAGTGQLNLRADFINCNPSTPDPAGPSVFTSDSWWHYRFVNNQLLSYCENANTNPLLSAPGNPASTTAILSNLDMTGGLPQYPPGTGTGRSSFQLVNPSGTGNATVVYIHINSTNPAKELNTEVAVGVSAKR